MSQSIYSIKKITQSALFLISSLILLAISSCAEISLQQINSENHNDRIRYLVIHHTSINYAKSLEALTKPHGVSAHYMISENGDPTNPAHQAEIIQLVDEQKRAWQAGRSSWQGQHNLNDQSIGIELVYVSNCDKEKQSLEQFSRLNSDAINNQICFYPDFDDKQIDLLIKLIKDIIKRNPEITADRIIGHADIAPNRRVDPGPRFPWHRLYKAGIGAWYQQQTVTKYWREFQQNPPSVSLIQKALSAYGYGILETGVLDAPTINALTAFQMHFRPWQVNGEITNETAATLFALLERYRSQKLPPLLQQYKLEQQLQTTTQVILSQSPFAEIFSRPENSISALVDNRRIFIGHTHNGKYRLKISSNVTSSAQIFVNGHALSKPLKLDGKKKIILDLSRYLHEGYNTLKVTKISPAKAKIKITMSYPVLTKVDAAAAGFSLKKLAKVDALINAEIKKGFPGAELLIVKNGKIIKDSSYGYQLRYNENGNEITQPEKITPNTLFDLASNTKMFATNFALMKLVSTGKLDINQPVHKYLAEYLKDGRESRTVRDLLMHTAGYAPSINFFSEKNQLGESFFSQNRKKTDYLLIQKVPFQSARNLKTVYSDTDFMLLGLIIERITGMPLDDYVEKEIYQPLGLKNTIFNPLKNGFKKNQCAATELTGNSRNGQVQFANIRTKVIQCEVHDEKAFYSMAGVSGHAGLFSTAKDLAVLTSVLLNRGGYGKTKLFSASVIDQFVGPSDRDISTAMGWRRAGNGDYKSRFGPYASPYAYGHSGWTGTLVLIDPFYDLSVILLTNRKHSPIKSENNKIIFAGDTFKTAQYGSVMSLIYEAFLENIH